MRNSFFRGRRHGRDARDTGGAAGVRGSGFTLVEVLAAMLLVGIVLPVVMEGISLSTRAASAAKARTEASMLANGKLQELIASDAWEGSASNGDFGTDWPRYKWTSVTTTWTGDDSGADLSQVDLTVTWQGPTKQESITVSTLARSTLTQ